MQENLMQSSAFKNINDIWSYGSFTTTIANNSV